MKKFAIALAAVVSLGMFAGSASADHYSSYRHHRNRREGDAHKGKYNGLGGKLHAGEDVVAGMRRELREEAGIECDVLVLRGTISWPGFGKQGEDWFGFVFRVDCYSGTPLSENPEGPLTWVEVDRILELPLWEGDRHFLPLVFSRDARQFHGVMPYRDGRPPGLAVSPALTARSVARPLLHKCTEHEPEVEPHPPTPSPKRRGGWGVGSESKGEAMNRKNVDATAIKDPQEWVTGDEPMTGAQDSYLHTLAREAGEKVQEDMTKAEASEKIEELQTKTGRGTQVSARKPRARRPRRKQP